MTSRLHRALFVFILAWLPIAAFAANPHFEELEAKLHLKPAQKVQYDLAVAATQRALLAIGLSAMEFKARFADEMRKNAPDLEALLRMPVELGMMVKPQVREAQGEWNRLFAMLDDEQVAIARVEVERQLGRLDDFGDFLRHALREGLRS
jgi:hypothetical protein